MSSVTRFIRQIQPDHTFFSASAVVSAASTASSLAFEFAPSASNVVGNYPPGTMNANVANLNSLILQAANAGPVVLRDMGKTIQAPLTPAGAQSFYRQVQLISLLATSVGGVQGGVNVPTNNTDYLTFYIPISVAGSAQAAAIPVHSACQM
jgi:hypothetical protein